MGTDDDDTFFFLPFTYSPLLSHIEHDEYCTHLAFAAIAAGCHGLQAACAPAPPPTAGPTIPPDEDGAEIEGGGSQRTHYYPATQESEENPT